MARLEPTCSGWRPQASHRGRSAGDLDCQVIRPQRPQAALVFKRERLQLGASSAPLLDEQARLPDQVLEGAAPAQTQDVWTGGSGEIDGREHVVILGEESLRLPLARQQGSH